MKDLRAPLAVYLHERYAGELRALDEDAPTMQFAYALEYVADDTAPPLSVSLPKRAEPYTGAPARNWFANVLPEGEVRTAVARRVGTSDRDDFGLLAAIGRECAGAVAIVPNSESFPPPETLPDPVPITPDDLHSWLHDEPRSLLAEHVPSRLSLAGAQNKLAVVVLDEGVLGRPAASRPSTHILKAPNARYPGLVSLEALVMQLALRVGLSVPAVRLVTSDPLCLLVDRFDRVLDRDGRRARARIHQEDFCQALGVPPELKYESMGGPSFAQCADLIRSVGAGPAALRELVRWAAFNVWVGNADAHGKNVALVHDPSGSVKLAPFYDLTSTTYYPASRLSRDPAMRFGSADLDHVDDAAWADFAARCGFKPDYVLKERERMRGWILRVLEPTAEKLARSGADRAVMERAVLHIGARARGEATGQDDAASSSTSGAWGMSL